MIISRTPLRISFVGGGSDLPAFYRQELGAVVSTAINKYIYITVNPKFDQKIRASYSRTEIVNGLDDLQHELIREALKVTGIEGAIEITSISDIPSQGTGLGSSSTYTVGLLNALYAYKNHLAGAERLAREACQIEIERCGKPIGKQDQYIAAYGGLQFIRFNPDESVFVDPIVCQPGTREQLQRGLLMLYTGLVRSADDILDEQSRNTHTDEEKRASLRRMVGYAQQVREALSHNDLGGFGEVLHANWPASGQWNQQAEHRRVVRTGAGARGHWRKDIGCGRRWVPASLRAPGAARRDLPGSAGIAPRGLLFQSSGE